MYFFDNGDGFAYARNITMETTTSRRILLFQLRHDDDERVRELHAVSESCGVPEAAIRSVDMVTEAPHTIMLDGVRAMIIGGSKYSVFEEVPNQDALIEVLREARSRRIPVMGICYGAQLIAHAFGGEVIRDKANEECGTFMMRTSEDAWTDLLFADTPDEFAAQCAHHDRVTRLPAGATLLASSERCGVQAFFMAGADIYGFQFHPERTADEFRTILTLRLTDHTRDQALTEQALASLKDSREATLLVKKFMERVVGRAEKKGSRAVLPAADALLH